MRGRKEIELEVLQDVKDSPVLGKISRMRAILEVLLDIREQLVEANKKEITGVLEDKSNN